jgi:hypothetical protein
MEENISQSLNSMNDPEASMRNLGHEQEKIMNDQKMKSSIKSAALEDQLEEFRRQTKDLIRKEDAYEDKLEKQEQERMEYEQRVLNEEVKRQTNTANQLLFDMKSLAEEDNSYKIKEMNVKREMQNAMKEVEDKLNEKRINFVNKMQRLKSIHELTKKKAAIQLLDTKRNLGKQLVGLSAKGDPSKCLVKNPIMQNEYCTHKYSDNFELQLECKKPKQFCYICCDGEIPEIEKLNVSSCYKKCDDLENGEYRTFNEIYSNHNTQVAFLS